MLTSNTWRESAIHKFAKLLGVHVSTRPCWCDVKYAAHDVVMTPNFVTENRHPAQFFNNIVSSQFANQTEGTGASPALSALARELREDMTRCRTVLASHGPEAT